MSKLSLSKEKIKVVLLEGVHPLTEKSFRQDGYTNIHYLKDSPEPESLKKLLADTHILGIRSRTFINEDILSGCKKLMAIGTFCIGTNQIDLKQARNHGIPVFNAPFSNTRSVAELVLAEIIFLMRGIPQKNAAAHRGQWLKTADSSFEIRGKKLGIVGFGHIGSQLGVIAESLGMRVYFYDIENKLPMGNAQNTTSLNKLLAKVEVLSLHVPATTETKNMIGKQQFDLMQQGSFLINASRGDVVVIEDLIDALDSGQIKGAALDVFPQEPSSNTDPFVSKLTKYDQVIITPHIGGSTQEAQVNIANEVTSKLLKYSNNGTTSSAVNFPQVSIPKLQNGQSRIMHIHKNKPGVLEKINHIFASLGINIDSLHLQTAGEIGYVIMDVNGADIADLKSQLQEIDGTLRVRILHGS
ncbi:D-3-phosphoglycerate dehydrogenase [hydrothermal vent metagenome]|uniref:2-oxoglutarate reductase n=1 Tax=hydrothermal vent metagenome TaxID=652676 RepID=A0A3B0VY87_9ZZZZ